MKTKWQTWTVDDAVMVYVMQRRRERDIQRKRQVKSNPSNNSNINSKIGWKVARVGRRPSKLDTSDNNVITSRERERKQNDEKMQITGVSVGSVTNKCVNKIRSMWQKRKRNYIKDCKKRAQHCYTSIIIRTDTVNAHSKNWKERKRMVEISSRSLIHCCLDHAQHLALTTLEVSK